MSGDKKEIKELNADGKKILEASQKLMVELQDLKNIYKRGSELYEHTKPQVAEKYEMAKLYVESMLARLETAQAKLIDKGDHQSFMKMISMCRESVQTTPLSLPNTLSFFSTPGKHLIIESLTKAEDKINAALQSLQKKSMAKHHIVSDKNMLN